MQALLQGLTKVDGLITASGLSVHQGGRQVLRDVSVQIGTRDFITVIGPNGAGKSTLLKCLLGSQRLHGGSIRRKDKLRVSYVPQRFAPDHVMPITVRRFMRLRKSSNDAAVAEVMRETGISEVMDRMLFSLSGGELQRVLLARSLLDEPELLVLDEPAQNLDISGQIAFYKLLDDIYRNRELSILMVSHDLHMVMSSTKQVICLFHHVCCSGEPHAVARDPEFIALFGKDMAKMVAVYQHHHSHSHGND